MRIPDEFKQMARRFDDDSIPVPFDEHAWITSVVDKLDNASKSAIRLFLDELAAQNVSGGELQEVWRACHPEYILSDKDLKVLLQMIRQSL